MAARLGIELGWHYLLDLIWVIEHFEQIRDSRIIDAGAGVGIIQWYLAEEGAEVISVDRQSRADLPLQFRLCYSVEGLREDDLNPLYKCIIARSRQETSKPRVLLSTMKCVLRVGLPKPAPGRVLIYNQDLLNLDRIEDNSIDTVVSISALEHNQREKMSHVVAELVRILKPGGKLLATVNASKDQDWFHEPSQGWCLSEVSIREVFGYRSPHLQISTVTLNFFMIFANVLNCAITWQNSIFVLAIMECRGVYGILNTYQLEL